MKPLLVLALAALAPSVLGTPSGASVLGGPVHVALKATAAVSPDAADFFSLGSIAALTGGDPVLRARLAQVPVGRAPLPGDVRHLTRGDLTLKLRQAGFVPGQDALLEGAMDADVTAANEAPSSPSPFSLVGAKVSQSLILNPLPRGGEGGEPGASRERGILIHRGAPVTICINDGDMSITAKGVARDNGAAGDTIHVHRDDCLTDLVVTVLDAQTVQLEL